jgi:hypothetical protein
MSYPVGRDDAERLSEREHLGHASISPRSRAAMVPRESMTEAVPHA